MLRNWVNLLLMAAAAALLLVASGVPATSAMAHGGAAMAMQSPCGAMPSPKTHCAVGCMVSPCAAEKSSKAAVPAALSPCCGRATALHSAPPTLDPPPPRPRS